MLASSAEDAAAVEAVKAHHAQMAGQLGVYVELMLTSAAGGGGPFEDARSRMDAFCRDELVPHALAEEQSLYPAAAGSPSARLLVESMVAEHRVLTGLVDEVSRAAEPLRAAAAGYALKVLFDTHLTKENDLVLPVVAADPEVSLAAVLEGMHELLGADAEAAGCGSGGACGCGSGHGHGHASEPTERSSGAAASSGTCGCGGHDEDDVPELDVRSVPHAIRHATVFGAFDAVPAGGSLLLVAPHDPVPLLKQLAQRCGGRMTVSYVERGPEAWRLLLSRG
ncbi:MAG: DUF2249 domain-containing protein [Actinomycetes bacterium]